MSEPRSAPRSGDAALDDTMELARRREKNARPDRSARIGAMVMGLPFLAAAGWVAMMWGPGLVGWYRGVSGL